MIKLDWLYMADLGDWVAMYGVSLHAYADNRQLYLHLNRTEISSTASADSFRRLLKTYLFARY